MNRVLDYSLVGLALLASAGYALSSLGPKGLRRRMWAALALLAARAPAFLRLSRLARRLDEGSRQAAGACGGCGTCGSEPPDAHPPSASEFRVPAAKIGKRH
ncbi:MAG: DUF6587 family protein [Steroidobacteraceae bacterium]